MSEERKGADSSDLPPTVGAEGVGAGDGDSGSLVGTLLAGRYRILRLLGEGAMGSVYLGEHVKIGRQDAIKVLRSELATDREAIARFVRGTRNVSMIRHPNICTIYDYSDTDHGDQFVAMELVTGETLRDLMLREGTLPLERAVHVARQVADALEAAHDAGIVHRDLKPANIMISRGRRGEDEIKVVDFDIAKGPRDGEGPGEEVTRLGFVIGTPEYMSPEQLIGDRLDGRSDLYSLALVLFRMLTGSLPFRAEGAQDLIVKRLTEAPMRLSDALPGASFPEALERAIQRALERKAEDRQSGAEEFGHEIVAAIGGLAETGPSSGGHPAGAPDPASEGTVARTLLQGPRPERGGTAGAGAGGAPAPARRGRTIALAAAGVAVLVAAVGGGLAMMSTPEPPPALALEQRLAPDDAEVPIGGADASAPPAAGDDPTGSPAGAVGSAPASETPDPPRPAPPSAPPSSSVTPGAPPAGAELGGTAADDLLVRLVDRVGPPYPARGVLTTIRDSAQLVSASAQASSAQRATANYIMASALLPLGDTAQAITVLERALQINPGHRGATTLLNAIR